MNQVDVVEIKNLFNEAQNKLSKQLFVVQPCCVDQRKVVSKYIYKIEKIRLNEWSNEIEIDFCSIIPTKKSFRLYFGGNFNSIDELRMLMDSFNSIVVPVTIKYSRIFRISFEDAIKIYNMEIVAQEEIIKSLRVAVYYVLDQQKSDDGVDSI